jgi:hypothetical protein
MKKSLILILYFIFTISAVFADEHSDALKIELYEPMQDIALEEIHFKKNESETKINDNSFSKGNVKLDLKEDKKAFGENFSKAEFSNKINSFLDFNTGLSIKNNSSEKNLNISDFNFSTGIIPYHKMYIGQVSANNNSPSSSLFNAIEKKHNLGSFNSFEDLDFKILKENGFINYSAGAYNINSGKNKDSINNRNPITGGWAAFNPFYGQSGMGQLQLGGGYFTNNSALANPERENNYSIFAGYKLSRFALKGEVFRQNTGIEKTKTDDRWNLSNSIGITNRLNFKSEFEQNQYTNSAISNFGLEYSFKTNPLLTNDNLKIELDASLKNGEGRGTDEGKRFSIKTKYSF